VTASRRPARLRAVWVCSGPRRPRGHPLGRAAEWRRAERDRSDDSIAQPGAAAAERPAHPPAARQSARGAARPRPRLHDCRRPGNVAVQIGTEGRPAGRHGDRGSERARCCRPCASCPTVRSVTSSTRLPTGSLRRQRPRQRRRTESDDRRARPDGSRRRPRRRRAPGRHAGRRTRRGDAPVRRDRLRARERAPPDERPDGRTPEPFALWPTSTFFTRQKTISFNDEPIEMLHQPAAHTDGDLMVFFRRSDVLAVGDSSTRCSIPSSTPRRGGSMRGILDGLNEIIRITVPRFNQMAGHPRRSRARPHPERSRRRRVPRHDDDRLRARQGRSEGRQVARRDHEGCSRRSSTTRCTPPPGGPARCSSRPSMRRCAGRGRRARSRWRSPDRR
jgi:glyoxylase-like metal-dependent hydrolase (beta-lactamase superfamily II)